MEIHVDIKKQLQNALDNDKISHTILLHGKCGYGTLPLAHWYAQRLLCKKGDSTCLHKVTTLQHADYHFCFPVATTSAVKKPTSEAFLGEWRTFFMEQPFGSLYDWMQFLDVEKKQGKIIVEQAKEIINKLNLRSYEGGYKVMIIWLPETMNNSVANKLLKILEEPPKDTVFILVSEKIERLLPTIISRCQIIKVPRLQPSEVSGLLEKSYHIPTERAEEIAKGSEGDMSIALANVEFETEEFEELFIEWVRNAFVARKKLSALLKIYDWAMTLSSWSRERQKQFLGFCSHIFRQALLSNYGAGNLVYNKITAEGFKWDAFSPFIHGANIEDILQELNKADFHVDRNGNGKIIFLDLGIKMTRYIHAKEI